LTLLLLSLRLQFVISVDLRKNDEADQNILLAATDSWEQQQQQLLSQLTADGSPLSSVVCVAGGWAGGNAADARSFMLHSALFVIWLE
jgi:hypothetical protein